MFPEVLLLLPMKMKMVEDVQSTFQAEPAQTLRGHTAASPLEGTMGFLRVSRELE